MENLPKMNFTISLGPVLGGRTDWVGGHTGTTVSLVCPPRPIHCLFAHELR